MTIPELFNIGFACTEPKITGHSQAQTAIIVENQANDVTKISYQQLAAQSNSYAHALTSLKIKSKDRVMLWLPNCLEFPIAFFGILKIGAIAVPASTLLTGEEADYLAKDSGAKILVTTLKLWQRKLSYSAEVYQLDTVVLIDSPDTPSSNDQVKIQTDYFNALIARHSAERIETKPTQADDPAYLVYTSGTTGYPKGVLHAHRALIGRSPAGRYWFNYQPGGDRILHSGKFNWTYVLGTALMDPLFLGKTVVVYEGDNQASIWPKLIAKHQCSIFIGVPTTYRQIVQKTHFVARDVPTLKHCMCAGEHLSDEMQTAWKQRFKQNIYEAVGMSECSYYLSQHPGTSIRPGSAGFPQPGHTIALLDENMQAVEDDAEGMLCVGLDDPGLFIEYWGLPDETRRSRKQGYFLTGDYAYRDQDGYYWFLGRKDDIINSFGFRISPHEIERVIKTHPQVADCVALEEQADIDKTLVVICVIALPGKTIDKQQLIEFSAAHLARYKTPKKVYLVDDFPRTANGKVIRKQLKIPTFQPDHDS